MKAKGDTASDNAMQAAGIEGLPIRQNPKGVKRVRSQRNWWIYTTSWYKRKSR